MAIISIPAKQIRTSEINEVRSIATGIGIDYERWENLHEISADASDQEILDGFSDEIKSLVERGCYVTADVINVVPTTPGLGEMLAKFNKEHWHDDDEVRFIVKGRGLFHIAPEGGDVVAIEMEAGDLIRVPAGTLHWFDLCGEQTIRAIRLFKDMSGWTPRYTDSGVDTAYQPLCFGTYYLPAS